MDRGLKRNGRKPAKISALQDSDRDGTLVKRKFTRNRNTPSLEVKKVDCANKIKKFKEEIVDLKEKKKGKEAIDKVKRKIITT